MELLSGPNLAALLTVPGIGEKKAVALANHFGTWDHLTNATAESLSEVLGPKLGAATAPHLTTPLVAEPLPPNTSVVSRFDPTYPEALRDLTDAPTLLWCHGTLPPPRHQQPLLAVVGTRTPNQFGAAVATAAADHAAHHNIATVSGLALGCDTLAHEASLDAGQPTWAVIGQGLNTFPTTGARANLAARIVANGGGVLSEVPPSTPVASHLLTKRNRLQSGLSSGVFIAQTGLATGNKPAGTLHTVRYAIEQHRILAVAVPPQPLATDPAVAGNVALTNPHGADPALIHATHPDTIRECQNRRPLADVPISSLADFATLWEHILRP